MRDRMQELWDNVVPTDAPCPQADPAAVKRRVNAALNAVPSERRSYMRQKIRLAAAVAAVAGLLAGTALAAASQWNVLDYYYDDGAGSGWEDLVDNTGYSAHNDVYAFTVESVAADSSSAMMLVRLEGLTEQTAANLQRDDWMGMWSFYPVNRRGDELARLACYWREVIGHRTETSKLLLLHVNFDGATPEQVELWLDCNEPFFLTLPLDPIQPTVVEVNASGRGLDPAGEVTLHRVELTPLSMGLEVTWLPSTDWRDPLFMDPPRPPVSLRTADGRTVALTELTWNSRGNIDYPLYWDSTSPQDVRMEFSFQAPQELSQYTALVVWGEEYPIPSP